MIEGGSGTTRLLLAEVKKEAGVGLIPVGELVWHDHVLTTSLLLGNVSQLVKGQPFQLGRTSM